MTSDHPVSDRLTTHEQDRLRVVRDHVPDLIITSVTSRSGQFNDVLVVNDELIFRFPRTDDAAAVLAREAAVLRSLEGRLPIPIPAPTFVAFSPGSRQPVFMGYRRLPGEPLDRETLRAIQLAQPATLHRLGRQAGEFLRTLHASSDVGAEIELLLADDAAFWSRMLDAFRAELFQHVRAEAREEIERRFDECLSDPTSFAWRAVLRHGDFGGANLLYDAATRRLTGVIDFGAATLGDPAVDLAALEAFYAPLALAMRPAYSALFTSETQRRAAFYRSTFALQQALWALRSGDDDAFEDGIANYR